MFIGDQDEIAEALRFFGGVKQVGFRDERQARQIFERTD
jgi:hypothetical protein